MYRWRDGVVQVFLVHPGNPYDRNRDLGVWSIPKGEYSAHDDPFTTAVREFREETGSQPEADGEFIFLGKLRQSMEKIVTAWAFEGNCDPTSIKSNLFSMEWPKGSGQKCRFPEVDRGEWFDLERAREKILKGQVGFIDRLLQGLNIQD